MMEIAAIPPIMPPMMASQFEPFPPISIDAGMVVIEEGAPKALVGPLAETEGSEGLSILPGSASGESIKHMAWA